MKGRPSVMAGILPPQQTPPALVDQPATPDPIASSRAECELQQVADRIASAHYSPPGMIVDRNMNILHLRGAIADFIRPAPGVASWHLSRVLKPSLVEAVTAAAQKGIDEGMPSAAVIPIDALGERPSALQLDVLPIPETATTPPAVLVSLQALSREQRPVGESTDGLESVKIDPLHRSQQHLVEARDYAESLIECVPVPLAVVCEDLTVQRMNTAFRVIAGLTPNQVAHRAFPALLEQLWGFNTVTEHLNHLFAGGLGEEFEIEHTSTTADKKILRLKGLALRNEGKTVILIVMDDITLRRYTEVVLEEQRKLLMNAVEQAGVKLDRTQEDLRELTAHLFSVQEEERQKVARELHDDISQRLSALSFAFESCVTAQDEEQRRLQISDTTRQLQSLSSDVRRISHHLHPAILDDLGLSTALRAMVTEFGEREDMIATYLALNLPDLPMQPAVTAIYRVAQEALRNVAKHAGKTHVKVILEARDGDLRLEVVDLGIGFDQDTERPGHFQGLGVISMKERARMAGGTVHVRSALGFGTTVSVQVPYVLHT